jgi:hypothetical protein
VTKKQPPDEPRTWRYFGMTWNEADAKLAIITVGGTIFGGLLLVLIVGGAVAVAHYQTYKHNPLWAFAFLGPVCLFAAPIFYLANKRRGISGVSLPLALLGVGLFSLLVLIGYAAGIK